MLKQAGKCACCGGVRKLVVDHNHKTGVVRGLICNYCNMAIGFIENCTEQVAEYLGG